MRAWDEGKGDRPMRFRDRVCLGVLATAAVLAMAAPRCDPVKARECRDAGIVVSVQAYRDCGIEEGR